MSNIRYSTDGRSNVEKNRSIFPRGSNALQFFKGIQLIPSTSVRESSSHSILSHAP